MELLHYLDVEQSWLSTVEEKVKAADNLPESTEAVNQALEVHIHTSTQAHSNHNMEKCCFCSVFFD